MKQETKERLASINDQRAKIKNRLIKLRLGDNLEPLDLSNSEPNGFVEYQKGVFIRDITGVNQLGLGITILHVLVNQRCEFSVHKHEKQSQSLLVKKGKAIDMDNGKIISAGGTHYVDKDENHNLVYTAGSELLFVYLPNLEMLE